MGDLAEMSDHRLSFFVASGAMRVFSGPGVVITRERDLFDAAMNAGLFEGFERGGLGVGQSVLNSTFREDPVAAAGSHEEKFGSAGADAIANCSDLLAAGKITRL
jgi:hypothetical protein